jgi:hypothetical protein
MKNIIYILIFFTISCVIAWLINNISGWFFILWLMMLGMSNYRLEKEVKYEETKEGIRNYKINKIFKK